MRLHNQIYNDGEIMTLRKYLKNRPITTTSSDPFSNNKNNAVIYVINTEPSKCIPLCMPLAEKMLTDTELDKEIDRIECINTRQKQLTVVLESKGKNTGLTLKETVENNVFPKNINSIRLQIINGETTDALMTTKTTPQQYVDEYGDMTITKYHIDDTIVSGLKIILQ